ncbi:AMP-binding protein [Candidatus Curtissbacteria bacterium]|nr:AMP-binding protein [Candidatus Curtissbacteria bacterium]
MQNLGQFLEKYSRLHKDHVAYQIKRGLRTQRFTFEEINLLAYKTAAFLSGKGLKKGDKVSIWSSNMPEYPILYFGCWLLGLVVVPIDVRTTEETLKIFLEKAKCRVGFAGKFIPGNFGKLVDASFYLEELTDLIKNFPNHPNLPNVKPDDLAEIAFTSGTTGTPKGVILTHGNFLSGVSALCEVFPFKPNWRALSVLPLSHAFEQVVDFLALFKVGITVTYLERINSLTIIRALFKNKITSVALVPQALRLLMNGIEREIERQGKLEQFKTANKIAPYLTFFLRRMIFLKIHKKLGGHLTFFGCGSAPLDLKLAKAWENLGIDVFEGYGATETTAALTINTPRSKRLGSVGKVLPGMKIRLNPDVSTQHTPGVGYVDTSGVVGEIEASGPNISPGYFEDEEKTSAAFTSEEPIQSPRRWPNGLLGGGETWYKTGDVGQIDKDGFLYITGRESFRIVLPNGQKVYPEDLEKKLNAHPKVSEACVVGVGREEGEAVHAVLVTKFPKDASAIIGEVNQNLASHEQILSWSVWPDEDFPRTPILKIDRKKVLASISSKKAIKGGSQGKVEDKLINLISKVTKVDVSKIKESSILSSDLLIDSLGRVELLSLIEEELGVAVFETKINAKTTVGDLRKLVDEAIPGDLETEINKISYSWFFSKIRVILQNLLLFPLFSLFAPLEVKGRENLTDIKLPAIFYFNHIGVLDGLCVLRVLPRAIREKLVFAATSEFWEDKRGRFMEILAGGFPFDKKEKIKASLDVTGEFLDKGFSLILAPEGAVAGDDNLLQFKAGVGLLAVEMQVPTIPVKIDFSYREIFNQDLSSNWRENLPKKRRMVGITIGKPLSFVKGTDYEKAAKVMRQALAELQESRK